MVSYSKGEPMNEVISELISDIQRLSLAVVELQAIAHGKDPKLSADLASSAIKDNADKLRKMLDAAPKA